MKKIRKEIKNITLYQTRAKSIPQVFGWSDKKLETVIKDLSVCLFETALKGKDKTDGFAKYLEGTTMRLAGPNDYLMLGYAFIAAQTLVDGFRDKRRTDTDGECGHSPEEHKRMARDPRASATAIIKKRMREAAEKTMEELGISGELRILDASDLEEAAPKPKVKKRSIN